MCVWCMYVCKYVCMYVCMHHYHNKVVDQYDDDNYYDYR